VETEGLTWFFHEQAHGWHHLLSHLEKLPSFRSDWWQEVALPAFDTCETIAFERQ
jgi:hypothetical protein